MRILVRPPYPSWLQNRLFDQDLWTSYYREPWMHWRNVARDRGMQIDTWDMHPLAHADLVWMQDLPPFRQELIAARQAAPNASFILNIYETPIDRYHLHNPRNYDLFDAVITYNRNQCDEQKIFHCHLPIGIPKTYPEFKPFAARKPLVMINSNLYSGWLAPRNVGFRGLPVVGPYFGQWHVDWAIALRDHKFSLYGRRRTIARMAEEQFPGLLDIYGMGWSGEARSWLHKLIPPSPFSNAQGKTSSKLETFSQYRFCVAFENCVGHYGYISEKIFDCFYAGVVPVYLGDTAIDQYVPAAAFVDARHFRNDVDLLTYIRDCSAEQWQTMYEAGQAYLSSQAIAQFQPHAFATRLLQIIEKFRPHNPPLTCKPLS